jgi:hypothetical protein
VKDGDCAQEQARPPRQWGFGRRRRRRIQRRHIAFASRLVEFWLPRVRSRMADKETIAFPKKKLV